MLRQRDAVAEADGGAPSAVAGVVAAGTVGAPGPGASFPLRAGARRELL
jgi:hypothetical protein